LNPDALAYWQRFGDVIGTAVPVIAMPASLKRIIDARAVAVKSRYAAHLDVLDLDIVTQTLDLQPGNGFDLVVATNILVYYDLFHQALAKAAIARMMNPGGLLLVNHALPSQPASLLEYLGRKSVSYSTSAAYGDDVVVYRRRKF
jgi:chemotaxis methyl-accepting protein methylase